MEQLVRNLYCLKNGLLQRDIAAPLLRHTLDTIFACSDEPGPVMGDAI